MKHDHKSAPRGRRSGYPVIEIYEAIRMENDIIGGSGL